MGSITLEKLGEFDRYAGDNDAYARSGRRLLSSEEWSSIERVVADSVIVEGGVAAKEYVAAYEDRLKTICDGPDTIIALRRLAKKLSR